MHICARTFYYYTMYILHSLLLYSLIVRVIILPPLFYYTYIYTYIHYKMQPHIKLNKRSRKIILERGVRVRAHFTPITMPLRHPIVKLHLCRAYATFEVHRTNKIKENWHALCLKIEIMRITHTTRKCILCMYIIFDSSHNTFMMRGYLRVQIYPYHYRVCVCVSHQGCVWCRLREERFSHLRFSPVICMHICWCFNLGKEKSAQL